MTDQQTAVEFCERTGISAERLGGLWFPVLPCRWVNSDEVEPTFAGRSDFDWWTAVLSPHPTWTDAVLAVRDVMEPKGTQ